MSKAEDLRGRQFELLKVIERAGEKLKDGKPLWLCECKCGGKTLATASSLNSGNMKSCGYLRSRVKAGDKFGKLRVVKRMESKDGNALILCRCDGGNEKEYPTFWLMHGHVTSCGCLQGVAPIDLTYKRFGHVAALRPTEKRDGKSIKWGCRCDCGKILYRSHKNLKASGANTSCGCIQPEISRENMRKAIHRVEDTCIEKIESNKATVKSKSGVRGVFFTTAAGNGRRPSDSGKSRYS